MRERDREHAHADRADRREPELDLVARQPPGARLPTPMPIAANAVSTPTQVSLEPHHFGPEQDDHELQQRTRETRSTRCR